MTTRTAGDLAPEQRDRILAAVYRDLFISCPAREGEIRTAEEVEAFLKDDSPGAFVKVVDRLLQSRHYGEQQARHWLDVTRYADTSGFSNDFERPNAWRYRDYVIRSFNADKPFDRFIREQIAGDEIWPDNPEARIATAFNRHYPDEYNARNLMQRDSIWRLHTRATWNYSGAISASVIMPILLPPRTIKFG